MSSTDINNDPRMLSWKSRQPVRPPIAWIGGKYYLANWILEQFPVHRVYVEPFGGMANVLLKKQPSEVEIYNDLDGRLVNFFQVLRDPAQFQDLQRLCELTPVSREQFETLCDAPEPANSVERAHWFFVRCRQARGGMGSTKLTKNAWATSTRTRRNMPEPVSKYLSAIDGLADVADRFRTVLIEHLPAIELIRKYDKHDVLFYCDPPYPRTTLSGTGKPLYGYDMTDEDHRQLLQTLDTCKAKVLISGYDCGLYREELDGWNRIEKETHVQFSNSGQKRVECLWKNYS